MASSPQLCSEPKLTMAGRAQREPSPSSVNGEQRNRSTDKTREHWSGFRIIDIHKIFTIIMNYLSCSNCSGQAKLTETEIQGLGSYFQLSCSRKCGILETFSSSDFVLDSEEMEVNRRFIYASRALGINYGSMETLCALMDLPPPPPPLQHERTMEEIQSAVKSSAEESMRIAAGQEMKAECSKDITVCVNQTWQQRDRSAKSGVVSAIGLRTGKVLDLEVFKEDCHGCANYKGPKTEEEHEAWSEEHSLCCTNRFNSNGMNEGKALVNIAKRSLLTRDGARYMNYVGDEDSITGIISKVSKDTPYGDDYCTFQRRGCLLNVLEHRLKEWKRKHSGILLEDGKSLIGPTRLSQKVIKKLSTMYENALKTRNNISSLKKSIWAIFHHYRSEDGSPQHHFCPKGPDTWCAYSKAEMNSSTLQHFRHDSFVAPVVMDHIKPIFDDLTNMDWIQECFDNGYTPPIDEFSPLIWEDVSESKVLQRRMFDAVIIFNDGKRSHLELVRKVGITPGKHFTSFCEKVEGQRKGFHFTDDENIREKPIFNFKALELKQVYDCQGKNLVFIDQTWNGDTCRSDRDAITSMLTEFGFIPKKKTEWPPTNDNVASCVVVNFNSFHNDGCVPRDEDWIHDKFFNDVLIEKPKILLSFRYKIPTPTEQITETDTVRFGTGHIRPRYNNILWVKIYINNGNGKVGEVSRLVKEFISICQNDKSDLSRILKQLEQNLRYLGEDYHPIEVQKWGFGKLFYLNKQVSSRYQEGIIATGNASCLLPES